MKKTVYFIFTLVLCVVTFNLITISNAEAKVNYISIHGIGAYEAANRMGVAASFKKQGYEKALGLEAYVCRLGTVGPVSKVPFDTIIYADKSGYVKAISFNYLDKNKKTVYPKIKKCIMNLYGDMDKALADAEQIKKCLASVMVYKKPNYYKSESENCYYPIVPKDDDGVITLTIMCTDALR